MLNLFNRNIVLGISGGIPAYKCAELIRLLRQSGANVRVVMTAAACEFITPLTFQALSQHPVHTELLDYHAEAAMGHIELARWADRILIAPATADCLARIAQGRSSDLLGAICLASDAPLLLAPSMNQAMWRDPATEDNCQILRRRGIILLGPEEGEQACGDFGPGRMMEPQTLCSRLADSFENRVLASIRVVITAGPTHEPMDPVRFLSNRSSGKMGYALAEAAVSAGALVTLVSGPTKLSKPPGLSCEHVTTALQMRNRVMSLLAHCDVFIGAAAVADYRFEQYVEHKIKKDQEKMQLSLVRNPDIISEVTTRPSPPFTVGFAAESGDIETLATQKLKRKRLNMICANQINKSGIGFDSDDNEILAIWRNGQKVLAKSTKRLIAEQLIKLIAIRMQKQVTTA